MSHHILPIQRLHFGFKSRALRSCVIVPTQEEILIGHVLLIQPFDWVQNSSNPIFYPTLWIQWSNFKSNCDTRWTRVVSVYNETSITFISNTLLIMRVTYYINITKNWENDMQNTAKIRQNDLEWICIWLLILPF